MDKQFHEMWKYITKRAGLLSAIRLPDNVFKANAGMEIVSSILFLKSEIVQWKLKLTRHTLADNGFAINSYFIDTTK